MFWRLPRIGITQKDLRAGDPQPKGEIRAARRAVEFLARKLSSKPVSLGFVETWVPEEKPECVLHLFTGLVPRDAEIITTKTGSIAVMTCTLHDAFKMRNLSFEHRRIIMRMTRWIRPEDV